MTTNLKNISDFAKENNGSFSDYKNLNDFRDKLAFTKIKKNKNTIKNMKGGAKFSFGDISKLASQASEAVDKGSKLADQATVVATQAADTANKLGEAVDTVKHIPGVEQFGELVAQAPQLIPVPTSVPTLEAVPVLTPEMLAAQQIPQPILPKKEDDDEDGDGDDDEDEDDGDEDGTANKKMNTDNISVEYKSDDDNSVNNNPAIIVNGQDTINTIKNDKCSITRGTILHFPTTKFSTINEKNLDFGDKISMFTPDLKEAIMKIEDCGKGNVSASIHTFSVDEPIGDIRIGDINDAKLVDHIEELDNKFCNKNYRGIMFKFPSNEINNFTKENNGGTHTQYWLCNPSANLKYLYSQQCVGYKKMSKKIGY